MADSTYTDWRISDGLAPLFARLQVPSTGLAFAPDSLSAQVGEVNLGSVTQPVLRSSISYYNGGLPLVDLGAGLVLSTGDAQPGTENTRNLYGYAFGAGSLDADLLAVAQGAIGDLRVRAETRVLDVSSMSGHFSVSDATLKSVRMDIVFASECYPDLGRNVLGGIGAVFVNGVNQALFNSDASTPLSVQDLNNDGTMDQPVFLLSDKQTPYPFELDALSRKLTVIAPVLQGSNTFKVAVGDVYYDEAGSTLDSADSVMFVSALQGTRYTNSGLFEVVTGTPGADTPAGHARREFFELGAGNDQVTASGGDDVISAGPGMDTLQLRGARADYDLSNVPEKHMAVITDRASLRDGRIDLDSVEVLQFSDRKVAIDLSPDGGAGQAALALGVIYPQGLSDPQIAGLALGLVDAGLDVAGICKWVADNGTLAQLAGSTQPADIARMVVRNVLHTDSAAMVDLALSYMDGRNAAFTPVQFLGFVAGLDLNLQAIDLVGLQQRGLEFV